MTLSPGARFGPYELLSLIGVGGMGEVYKARDKRLDRIVAIKLLPSDLAERPDRRRRFEMEARAISSLSHPHICPLFDVGEDQGRAFLVMEYLEGETLDDRLTRGALPASDVLRYASQIADALDHAHRAQIVHRDLKPSNVMLTQSGPKLLDFGLAKRSADELPGPASTASFDERKLTAEGTVIGTFQYMAPEQLEGRPADPRSDIFALGMLLYEMATGRKAFHGDSQASLIASILTAQPPLISAVRQAAQAEPLPPALDHIVDRCLAKNPVDRWHSARDIKLELDWVEKGGSQRVPPTVAGQRHARAVAWGLAVVAIAIAATFAFMNFRAPADPEITRFTVTAPTGTIIGIPENRPRVVISRDGRQLAFVASSDGLVQIWVRSRDSLDARPLAGTEGGLSPFWSPDSRFIGFFDPGTGELKKIDPAGGPARTISAAESDGSPTWGANGIILFTQFRDGIYRVPAEGGTPERVTQLDKTKGEMNHYWPTFLPDGRQFFYMATARDANRERMMPSVYLASLDSPADAKRIAHMHSKMVYASSGHALFVEDGVLMAQPFDLRERRLVGEARNVADGVAYYKELGNGAFSVSDNGMLAYQSADDLYQLVWYDRRGVMTDTGWQRQGFGNLRLSPDARHVAADVIQPRTGMSDVWIYDVARGAPVSFTTDGHAKHPVWSPDARRIAFRSARRGAPALMARTFDGVEELLVNASSPLKPEDWSPDGKWVAYTNNTRKTSTDIWLVDLTGDRKPTAFLNTQADEWAARFSPDSNWLAFVSNELGTPEIYVASIRGGEKTRISVGGGSAPRWRKDGKELFYSAPDHRSIMSVRVALAPTIQVEAPRRLFEMRTESARVFGLPETVYDVTPDGERFIVSVAIGQIASSRITVVLNWPSALRQ